MARQCENAGTDACIAEALGYPPDEALADDVLNATEQCPHFHELSEDETCPYADWLREYTEYTDKEREALRKARDARSRRYGIEVLPQGHLTKPGEYKNIADNDFGDPVNWLYPIDASHVRAAITYMAKNYKQYKKTASRRVVWNRIIAAARSNGIKHKYNTASPLDRLLNPSLKRWAKKNAGMGAESIEAAQAAISEAATIADAMRAESEAFIALEGTEGIEQDAWRKVLEQADHRLRSLAEEQGLDVIEDAYANDKPQIDEGATVGEGEVPITGTFARVNILTANGRVYPQSVWEANEDHIEAMLMNGKLIGMEGHPGWFSPGTDLGKISVLFTDIWQDRDRMRYKAKVLNTASGENLKQLIRAGVGVEWSTRGFGSVEKEEWENGEEVEVVQDDYVLAAIDSVFEGAAPDTSIQVIQPEEQTAQTEPNVQESQKEDTMATQKGQEDVIKETVEKVVEEKPPQAVPEDTAELKARLEKLEQEEALRAQREALSAHVEEKIAAEEVAALPAELRSRLESALTKCTSVEDIDKTFEVLYAPMKEAAEIKAKAGVGIQVHADDETELLASERRPLPETPAEVVNQLVEGLVADGMRDTGEDNPTNPVWCFRRIIENYQKEHPYYINVLTREGFARHQSLVEATTSSDIAVGAPYILPLFRRTFPRLIAQELCSVQPIDRPDGKVFFLNPLAKPSDSRLDQSANFDSTYADHTEEAAKARVGLSITEASISATEKSIEAKWTSVLQQDIAAYHGLNAEEELLNIAANEIAREVNYTILEDMRSNASGSSMTFEFISRAGGEIASKKYRRPNWLVCDPIAASRFSALNNFVAAAPDEQNTFGIDVTYEGVLSNRWRVYSVGWFTTDTIMLGYKGQDWNDTAYIYAPYVPVYVSPSSYNTSTNIASRSVNTRYATYLVDGDFFGLVTIDSGTAGTDLT